MEAGQTEAVKSLSNCVGRDSHLSIELDKINTFARQRVADKMAGSYSVSDLRHIEDLRLHQIRNACFLHPTDIDLKLEPNKYDRAVLFKVETISRPGQETYKLVSYCCEFCGNAETDGQAIISGTTGWTRAHYICSTCTQRINPKLYHDLKEGQCQEKVDQDLREIDSEKTMGNRRQRMDTKTRKLLLAVINKEIEFWKAIDNIDSRIGSTLLSECIIDLLAEDDGWEIGAAKIVVDYLGIPMYMTEIVESNDIGEDAEAYLDKLLEYLEYKDLLSGAKPQAIQPDSPTKSPSELE